MEELLDKSKGKGDIILDYRDGHEQLVQNLKAALQSSGKIQYAFDGVSEYGSFQNICQVLDRQTGKIALITPFGDYSEIPDTIEQSMIFAGTRALSHPFIGYHETPTKVKRNTENQ